MLSFLCVQTLQDMLSASQQDLEGFLTQVYRAIAGAAPLKDKVKPIRSYSISFLRRLRCLHGFCHGSTDSDIELYHAGMLCWTVMNVTMLDVTYLFFCRLSARA